MRLLLEGDENLHHKKIRVPWTQNAGKQQQRPFLRCNTDPLLELQYSLRPTDEQDLRPSGQGGDDRKAAKYTNTNTNKKDHE